jgi:hypothetical protein
MSMIGELVGPCDNPAVLLFDRLDDGAGVKNATFCSDRRGDAPEVFQRVKGPLSWIPQRMLSFAAGKCIDADDPVHRGADLANRFQFVIYDLRVRAERLEQKTVEPAEIAVDPFFILDSLDAVDRGRLALIEGSRNVFASQIDHRRRQVVAERGEVRRCPCGDAARNRAPIDHHDLLAFDRELIRAR